MNFHNQKSFYLSLGEKKVAVLIPTYNERSNITELIPRVEDVFRRNKINGHIIIVDDNSPDGTADVAENYSRRYGNTMVLRRPEKLGLGAACLDGFKAAFSINADIIVRMDADLSHDPKYIPEIASRVEDGYGVVVGSRYVPGGKIENWPLRRLVMSKVANWFVRVLLGIKAKDATSEYRAFSSDALKKLDFSEIKTSGYTFKVELLYQIHRHGIKIGEIPIVFVNRKVGKSKLGRKEIVEFGSQILALFLKRIKGIFT
jgi:dolichol-phosphate mannosyltransferase